MERAPRTSTVTSTVTGRARSRIGAWSRMGGVAVLLVIAATACGSDGGPATTASTSGDSAPLGTAAGPTTVRLWVGPATVECVGGAGEQTCLQVARSDGGEFELFYDSIDGFEFEEGTAYVIDVSVTEVDDPPADASSLRYALVEVISAEPVTDDT
jgi:hypothetical protein